LAVGPGGASGFFRARPVRGLTPNSMSRSLSGPK
jgi:hypothetical protein